MSLRGDDSYLGPFHRQRTPAEAAADAPHELLRKQELDAAERMYRAATAAESPRKSRSVVDLLDQGCAATAAEREYLAARHRAERRFGNRNIPGADGGPGGGQTPDA